MKILHIISSLSSGGAEIYVRDLATQMVCEGHDVYIAYVSDAVALGRSVEFQEDFKEQLHANGVGSIEMGHACRRWLWRGGARLQQIVNEFEPDVIHAHLYYGVFFKALARTQIPLLYTHHSHRLGKGRFLYPLLNKIVNQYIGVSRDCADVLRKAGASRVSVIYNGVNAKRLIVKDAQKASENVKIISVGRLAQAKNFPLLIEAMRLLFKRRNELQTKISFMIAGEGPLKEALQNQINSNYLTENITLLGNRSDIPELLNQSDLFVMSSDYEGLPIALLEAMMTGLPVVVTDVGGCRDVVEECNAGIVVSPGSAVSIAEAMERIIDNPKLQKEFSSNALENSKIFSIKHASDKHISIYKNLSD